MIEAMSAINAFASLPTAVGPWNCIVRCGSHQLSAALAAHRRSLTIDAAVQSAAATVLLQEGVEGGDQLGHRGWPTRSPDPPAAGATGGSSGRGLWRS